MSVSVQLLSVLPEALLLALALGITIAEPFWKEQGHKALGWITALGLLLILAVLLVFGRPASPISTFGGTIRFDDLAVFFKALFIFGAGITCLFMLEHETLGQRGESYLLLLASTIGMCLMASAADLIMLYLAIETTSIPLYVLAGFMRADDRSTEAGFKYLLYGAMTSAVMLYGFSLLFGIAGTTNIAALAAAIAASNVPLATVLGIFLLIVVGLGFKSSIVPFHFWAPDVYEGSPTPIAGFLSTASKAAGFVVIARLFLLAFPAIQIDWASVLAVLSAITMTVGNLLALPQRNLKRLLAYSSIAHAGYAMMGVVAVSELGYTSLGFYLLAYLVTNLAAFGIVTAVGRVTGSDDYDAYRGLSRRAPWLALIMLAAFLSLAGMPPFGGFFAKVAVFAAAMQANLTWLVVVGILNSVIGVYYYLNVMKYVYLFRMDGNDEGQHRVGVPAAYAIALVTLAAGVVLVGTVIAPWFGAAGSAASALF
jgi:NADH-quinone oxidoreductase subunit N